MFRIDKLKGSALLRTKCVKITAHDDSLSVESDLFVSWYFPLNPNVDLLWLGNDGFATIFKAYQNALPHQTFLVEKEANWWFTFWANRWSDFGHICNVPWRIGLHCARGGMARRVIACPIWSRASRFPASQTVSQSISQEKMEEWGINLRAGEHANGQTRVVASHIVLMAGQHKQPFRHLQTQSIHPDCFFTSALPAYLSGDEFLLARSASVDRQIT